MKEKILIVLGSKSDYQQIEAGIKILQEVDVSFSLEVLSAHRHPEKLRKLCKELEAQGVAVVVACAGMAAALPGFVASLVDIPVIGVALKGGLLDGLDALFSIVSTPKGIGLASSGVGKSAFINAAILALEILALKDKKYRAKVSALKKKFK